MDSRSVALETVNQATPAEKRAFRDLWRIYSANAEQVVAYVARELLAQPEMAAALGQIDPAEQQRRQAQGLERLGKALSKGEWEPWIEGLQEQGVLYAKAGIPYQAWYRLYGSFREALLGPLRTTYGSEPARLQATLRAAETVTDTVHTVLGQAYLETRESLIHSQQEALRELAAPVLQVTEGLCVIPLIGRFDPARTRQLSERVLRSIPERRARAVILDVTAASIEGGSAPQFLAMVSAARLLGARVLITGIADELSKALVDSGADLASITTLGDLESGIQAAEELLQRRGGKP